MEEGNDCETRVRRGENGGGGFHPEPILKKECSLEHTSLAAGKEAQWLEGDRFDFAACQ